MPWVMNAAFRVIKSWLPTKAVQKIKFVDKKTIKDFVDSSQALKIWGGEDNYEFSFVSENLNEGRTEENKKKVHFADGSNFAEASPTSFGDAKHDDSNLNTKLALNPGDAICFTQEGVELSGALSISNASEVPLIYKVKTTSPEKFRVRPSFGLLTPGANASINVVLLSGYSGTSILRDKFLVMCYPVEHENHVNPDLNDLWKANSSDTKKLEEHKLRCRVPSIQPCPHNGTPGSTLASSGSPTSEIEQKMSQLLLAVNHVTEVNTKIQSSLHFLQSLIIVIGIIVIGLGVALLLNVNGLKEGHCHAPSTSRFVQPSLNLDKIITNFSGYDLEEPECVG